MHGHEANVEKHIEAVREEKVARARAKRERAKEIVKVPRGGRGVLLVLLTGPYVLGGRQAQAARREEAAAARSAARIAMEAQSEEVEEKARTRARARACPLWRCVVVPPWAALRCGAPVGAAGRRCVVVPPWAARARRMGRRVSHNASARCAGAQIKSMHAGDGDKNAVRALLSKQIAERAARLRAQKEVRRQGVRRGAPLRPPSPAPRRVQAEMGERAARLQAMLQKSVLQDVRKGGRAGGRAGGGGVTMSSRLPRCVRRRFARQP